MDEICYPGDLFAKYQDLHKLFDMFAMAVHPEFRGRGLASKMVNQAFIVARKAGCHGASAVATSDYSRKIFNKIGMEEIGSRQWADISFDGKRIFAKTESEKLTSHYIKL